MMRINNSKRIYGALVLFTVFMMAGTLFAADEPHNLGPLVNSPDSDFGPIVTADGNALYFTSFRDGGLGGQDIWMSRFVDGEWTKAENLGEPINSKYHEGPDSFSVDESTMYFTRCDKLGKPGICDIYTASWDDENKKWGKVENMGPGINSDYNDSNASISYDGKTIYFISDRPMDGSTVKNWDIFMSQKTMGKWGKAKRLDKTINTPKQEIHVMIHQDGKTLYFSSDGHGGFGGYDIFYSELEDGKWSQPKNMGDLTNTPRDDLYFTVPASGDLAYLASSRSGGMGQEDIYSVPVPLKISSGGMVVLMGIVVNQNSCSKQNPVPWKGSTAQDIKSCKPLKDAEVIITESASEQIVGKIITDASGSYRALLTAGKKYTVKVNASGCTEYMETYTPEGVLPTQTFEKNILIECKK